MYIQDKFAMNLSKVEELDERMWNYDLNRIFYFSSLAPFEEVKQTTTNLRSALRLN